MTETTTTTTPEEPEPFCAETAVREYVTERVAHLENRLAAARADAVACVLQEDGLPSPERVRARREEFKEVAAELKVYHLWSACLEGAKRSRCMGCQHAWSRHPLESARCPACGCWTPQGVEEVLGS